MGWLWLPEGGRGTPAPLQLAGEKLRHLQSYLPFVDKALPVYEPVAKDHLHRHGLWGNNADLAALLL